MWRGPLSPLSLHVEELTEWSIKDRVQWEVGVWGSNGSLEAVWVGGIQINKLAH